MAKLKIRYSYSYPLDSDLGGGTVFVSEMVKALGKKAFIKELDLKKPSEQFDFLLVFGSTWVNLETLDYYKNKGVKIILFPIFDRPKPRKTMKRMSFLKKFPVLNTYSLRDKLYSKADYIITAGETEKFDLNYIYGVKNIKMETVHQGISSKFLEALKKSKIDFQDKFDFQEGFVFSAANSICNRKGQLELLKALKGSKYKIVLNNTHKIEKGLEKEFKKLTKNNPNVLCLKELTIDELVACYKACSVFVSLSNSETAGYVNLEAGYSGCNLVVNDIPAFREYLKDWARYTNRDDKDKIKKDIIIAMGERRSNGFKKFVNDNYMWEIYSQKLINILENL